MLNSTHACGMAVLMLCLLASTTSFAADPPSKLYIDPPPVYDYPQLREFFAFGSYGYTPDVHQEGWNARHLGRTTHEAIERHVRHLVLHNFNIFGTNLRGLQDAVLVDQTLPLADRYGFKTWYHLHCGYPVAQEATEQQPPYRGHVRWPLEYTSAYWQQFVQPYANDPRILYWSIYDETSTWTEWQQRYLFTLKQKLHEIDPTTPASFIDQGNGPGWPYFELGLSECYVHYTPEMTGLDLSSEETRFDEYWSLVSPQQMRLCVNWGYSHGNYEPTPIDIRAQVYHMLANGRNGFLWYQTPVKAPCWASWTRDDPQLNGMRTDRFVDQGFTNNFDFVTPNLEEASRAGQRLIPVGYLFLQGRYIPKSQPQLCEIDVETTPVDRSFSQPDGQYEGTWRLNREMVPAFGVGSFKLDDADALVVYSRSLEKTHQGRIVIDPQVLAGRHVYNLDTLEKTPLSAGGFEIELEPAGGALYLIADDAAYARHRSIILGRRFDHEANKLGIRMDIARGTGMVELGDADARMSAARQARADGDTDTAWGQFVDASAAFERAEHAAADYMTIKQSLRTASDRLQEMDQWLRRRLPLLMPEPVQGFYPPLGADRAALERILVDIRKASGRYYPLSTAFEAGESTEPNVFQSYVKELTALRDRLEAYRPATGIKGNIGLLTLDGLYDADAWMALALQAPGAMLLHLTGPGAFQTDEGKPASLDAFDAIWLHYNDPQGEAFLDQKKRIACPPDLIDPKTLDAFRTFLGQGRGMFVSGLATVLPCTLGLESVEPNVVEINDRRFMRYGVKSMLYQQGIGLHVPLASRALPLFDGLPSPLLFRADNGLTPVTRASWSYPVVPAQGQVMAWMTTQVNTPADRQDFDLVAFNASGGGVMIGCGLPKFDFSPSYKRNSRNYAAWYRNLQTFLKNTMGYLADPRREALDLPPTQGPFHHIDLAKIENNPDLVVMASSNRNADSDPLAPVQYRTSFFYKWDAVEEPAWIELDFGKTVEIGKLCIDNNWVSHSSWSINRFRIKTWDDKNQQWMDVPPGLSFATDDHRRSYESYVFTFAPQRTVDGFILDFSPLRTRKLRIEDLHGVEAAAPAGPRRGVSISNIVAWGRVLEPAQ